MLSIVCDFLLSSPSFDHEDSDSEFERFQKIRGKNFERAQALSHGAKIFKIHENVEFGDVWHVKIALGSCVARNL